MRGRAADDRLSRGRPDVADPLRLAGQCYQVVLAPVGSSQDRGPTRLPRPAAAELQRSFWAAPDAAYRRNSGYGIDANRVMV